MTTIIRRAAIYCRISEDREGAGLGVTRQEEDCRKRAEQLGWHVAELYVDNDVSAYSGKPRPQWQRLIADVKSGAIDAVLCWHVDRLTRSPRELEDVIDLADTHGLALATVTGDIDLSTTTGRMVARVVGSAARYESEHKGERQRRAERQKADAGKPKITGTRGYGYTTDRMTIVEDEAAIIRECAARLLAGETLRSLMHDLNARGVTTSVGGRWNRTTLRAVLASARISGRREYKPRESRRNTTRPLVGDITCETAAWPAIIAPEDSDRIRALLSQPERRTRPFGVGRKSMLSGLLVCSRCERPMVSRPRDGIARYVCNRDSGGCGRTYVKGAHADDRVRNLVLDALDHPDVAERLRRRDNPEPDLHARIRADEDELDELAAERGAGEISKAEWRAMRAPIVARLDAARARLARTSHTNALDAFTGPLPDMQKRWEDMNTSQRRAVVKAVVECVRVLPAAQLGGQLDPDRFDARWR